MQILPVRDFLLVAMRDLQGTSGGILLPEGVALHPHGEVLAVGPDAEFSSDAYTVGDLVLFLPQNLVMGFNEKTPQECFLLPASAVIGKYVKEVALDA